MLLKGAKVFINSHFQLVDVIVENGKFKEFAKNIDDYNGTVLDLNGKKIIPGLTDIHTHGCVGCDMCDEDEKSLENISKYMLENGILYFAPTTMTYPKERLIRPFMNAKLNKNKYAEIVGIHMEGPFISKDKIGAQNPDYLMEPDYDMVRELDDLSGGLLRIISLAPELENSLDFAKKINGKYVLSIAHSVCDYNTAMIAYQNGFSHLTHMYNAMNKIEHRSPGPIIAAYESGSTVEMIVDGVHIHEAVVRFSFDLFPADKICMISDSMRACGLADGIYDLGGQAVEKKGNKATLKGTNTIAGSASNLYDCMKCALQMGVDEEKVIRACTENPARVMNIIDKKGVIKLDNDADFLICDEDLNILEIYQKGDRVCKK